MTRIRALHLIPLVLAWMSPAATAEMTRDTTQQRPTHQLRTYTTTRLTVARPVIDGVLNDPAWSQGTWAGDFTQWVPREGAPPTYPTYLKVLYDDRNIYVAIRAVDRALGEIIPKLSRRDEFVGDEVGVAFDSYHDHRTGFEFDVSAAGQKADLILMNGASDANWNAVWDVKVGREDSAWTAEFAIPLSQLRYSSEREQVWGMHCWRWIDRLLEESDWEVQSSEGPGILYLFGELHGIRDLPPSQRVEVMPYTVGSLKTYPRESGNPFADKGRTWAGNLGLDGKIGIGSNFTADLTINPDFGQVEADPSVMNLTAFETFFEEKRPFFLEGRNIFMFDFDGVNLFYSRRIGHPPTYVPSVADGEHLDMPDHTAILGAVKLSGKTAGGLAIGVLQSVTGREEATLQTATGQQSLTAEPLTSYTIARVQQDFEEGNTVVGGILTSTNRVLRDEYLHFMPRSAHAGGLDLLHQWNDKEFYINAKVVGSAVLGSDEAIRRLQEAPARYFQRPDARSLSTNLNSTLLSGYGGQVSVGKGSKGHWRYSTQLTWRSPGLELNDLGYMQTADVIKVTNTLSYFVNQPESIFRTYTLTASGSHLWDFLGRYLSTTATGSAYLEFLNQWSLSTSFTYLPEYRDTRLLRGGPAIRVPDGWTLDFVAKTDPSRRIVGVVGFDIDRTSAGNGRSTTIAPELTVLPLTNLRLGVSVNYTTSVNDFQYVDVTGRPETAKPLYYLARVDQRSLSTTFRIDYYLTPELSVQYYGSPFASVGGYTRFKEVTLPDARAYADRFTLLQAAPAAGGQLLLGGGTGPATLLNPDFSFSQFRSVLVFRWEYLPGSSIYAVWSHERTAYRQPVTASLSDALRDLQDAEFSSMFLIKLSYWFSL